MGGEIGRDLFGGLRVLPSGKRGRPSHCWSQENENRVILGLAMGYKPDEIALGLGISTPTLRKHYFSALKRRDMERTRFELWRAEVLATKAADGDVSAMKELTRIMDRRDRHIAEQKLLSAADGETEAAIGKKEARFRAAEAAASGEDGDWGDLLSPVH